MMNNVDLSIFLPILYILLRLYRMSDDLKIFLIVQTSVRLAVDITFLIIYIFRICKLDKMASNNFHSKSKLIKFKIILLIVLQIIFTLHIILTYTFSPYWLNSYQNFCLIAIIEIINTLLQIYIIRKQHKKKALKARSIPIIWICWLILDIAIIIFVQVQFSSVTIILLVFQAMALVALIVIGFVLQQKSQLKEQFLNTVNNSLMISQKRNNTTAYSQYGSQMPDPNKIYVEFNKQFEVTSKDNKIFCQFKFIVYNGQQTHILTKKQEQFINLITQMKRSFPHSKDLQLEQNRKQSFTNIKRYGEEKQKIYQTFLIKLTQNQKYYTSFLFDFLEISMLNRTKLNKKREKHVFPTKKQSFHNQEQQKLKKPFFQVQLINGKIHVSNPQILQVVLNKSKSQIEKFHNKLISERKMKMELLNQDQDMTQLVHFIYRVVNSKNLWKSFCQWMVLGKQLQQKIYHMFDFWNYGFKNIQISIIGYQIAFDKLGSIHNLYLISLSQNKKRKSSDQHTHPNIILKEDFTLKKRFNDFVKLDKNIQKFISSYNLKIPSSLSLPPKFSPFGAKTSPKSRQIYLDQYLNEVLKIQNIHHCVKFLQFLEIDLGKYQQEFHTIDQQNLVSSSIEHVSSLIIDQMEQNF